ncbi:TB2/DP1, HVA22 family [Popillia japonica]|uniref:TB2/DP1, HVA22 family n=1 Tax=Popillia japonica TaxID=7064 RepID=A0AAW1LVT2_POPJA
MHALEPGMSAPFQVVRKRPRRFRSHRIVIPLIRDIIREICSCLSGIFVLKLNFVHTTKTSLNPTQVILVNDRSSVEANQRGVQITELPPDTEELASSTGETPRGKSEQPEFTAGTLQKMTADKTLVFGYVHDGYKILTERIIQKMTADKTLVFGYVHDGYKILTERITPALSRLSLLAMAFCVVWHQTLTQLIIYPIFRLLFGTLYPAYASYKAVKTKNVREYVKWMMYWIVFALFTCAETFTDVFLSWFPFYYEIKIILVIWLLSPATKGSSILYRKFVHPMLSSREQEIDDYISKAKEQSYKQVLDLGSKGVNALMQTAIKGGGGLVNQIRKSYSLSDLSEQRHEREYEGNEETDSLAEPRVVRRRHSPRRHSPRRHTTTSAIYFSELDVRHDMLGNIQTVDEISSGYSSGELAHASHPAKIQAREALVRTGSIGSSKLKPTRVTRSTTAPKKSTEDLEYKLEYPTNTKENIIYLNDKAQLLSNLMDNNGQSQTTKMSDSTSSEEEFRDCLDHDDEKINMEITHSANQEVVLKLVPPNDNLRDQGKTEAETGIERQDLIEKTEAIDKIDIKKDRGGKYNKHTAPLPPCRKNQPDFDLSAIKATLVLKPGVLKSLGSDLASNEIFCHSPKLKRRSLNISPSHSPSSSSVKLSRSPIRSKSKLDASLSRLKMLPKKITFWHKDDVDIPSKSRSSWYDISEDRYNMSKELSKSDDDVSKIQAREKLMTRIKLLMEEKGKEHKQ